jgi:chromosome segregation ATPase
MHCGHFLVAGALWLTAVGCAAPAEQVAAPPAGGEPTTASLATQIKDLKQERDTLKSQNEILTARLEEQLSRENRLAAQVNSLKSRNAQQRVQIEALAEAPIERDAARRQVQQLAEEIVRLKARIGELEAIINSLPTTTAPATTQAFAPEATTTGTAGD